MALTLDKRWFRRHFQLGAASIAIVVSVFGLFHVTPVQAATCSASVATITQTSSPIFYVDDPTYNYGYVSYQVATGASGSFSDLWVKVDGFTNTSLLGLASTEDGLYHVGSLGTSSSTNVYFLLKGGITASAQSYTLHLYNGKPGVGGTETCSSAQSNSSVATTIQSSNNTVSSVTYTAPYLGSTFTMTVTGDTGTIGSAGIFSYTPASQSSWNADCLELKSTNLTMSGGNTGTFTNGLYRSGLSSSTTHYVITYTFTAKCVTSSSTAVVPLSYLSSGTQVKHTSVSNYGTLPPIAPATNSLVMTKSVTPSASTTGGTVTYKLDVTNSGPSPSTIDDFSDVLPSTPATVPYVTNSTTYDMDTSDGTPASSISDPTISGQNLTWARAFTIPSGKTAELTYQATIPSTTGSYLNSAVAHSGAAQIDQTVDTTDNKPAVAIYGVGDPSMAASTKTAEDINGGSLQPGDVIEYTITAKDTGTNDATNVHISDTIDTNTNNLSNVVIGADGTDCGNGYANNTTTTALDITGITVGHGSSCVVTFRVTVKSSATAGTTILNSASIVPGNVGGISGDPSSAPMVVHKDPILSVTNTENDADNVVTANQVITYTTTITNSGQSDASGVDLSGTITGPVGSLSSRTLTNCGPSTTYVDTSALPSISIASLSIAVGTPCVISYTVTVNSGATAGSITNVANATAAREGGNDPSAVSASTLLIGAVATPPSLSATISENDADGYVNPDQVVAYTLNVQNSGQTDATTALTSAIPTGMGTPSSITYTNCGSPSSSYSAPTLTISSISIAAANTCTITFAVTVNSPQNEGTSLTVGVNVAQASQGGNDPANVNAPTLVVDATPILAITSAENDADNTVSQNQDIAYTITLSNSGDGQATGVPLTDSFTGPVGSPSDFTFSNCGSGYTNNSSTNVDVSGIAVQIGVPCVVTFHVTVNSNASGGSTITDTANVTSAAEGGNNPIPVSASTLTVASQPNISVAVADDDTDNVVTPGQTVGFTVTISNSGGIAATTSAAVAIPTGAGTPSSINFTNCGLASSSYSAPTLTLSSLTVGISASCVISFNLPVNSPNTEGRTLVVNADVPQASQGGNDPASVPSDTLTVDTTPNLSTSTFAISDANGGTLAPGDTINYTLTIKNTGNGSASGVDASSTMNSHVSLNTGGVSFSNCGGNADSSSTTSSLLVANLQIAVGTNCVIAFNGTLASLLNEGTSISGSASVTAASEGGSGASPSTGSLTVDATPALTVASSENDADNSVTPGQDVTYTVVITNTGNGDASGISLTDPVSGTIGNVTNFSLTGCGSSYSNTSSGTTVALSGLAVNTTTTCSITFHVTINSNAAGGSTVTDAANASAANEGGNNPAVSSASTLTVATVPDLGVTLTDNDTDNIVVPGQTIGFTLTITNSGNGTGHTGAVITIPSGLGSPGTVHLTSCGAASSSYNSPTLTLSNLAVTTSSNCVITFDGIVTTLGTDGATFNTIADVAASSEGGNNPASVASSTFTVDTTPNVATSTFTVADHNGGTLAPGDALDYTLALKNTGDGTATGVNVNSAVTSHATLTTSSVHFSNCGSSYSDSSTISAVNITNLQITVGTSCVISFSAVLDNPLNNGTAINGTATVGAADEGGSGASLTSNTLAIDATPALSTSTLSVSDLNGSTTAPGDILGYTLTIKNTGDGQATGVHIADAVNSGSLDISSITFSHCGSSYTNTSTSSHLAVTGLQIAVGTDCVVYFETPLHSPLNENTAITGQVTIDPASEGGSGASPAATTLHIDATPQLGVTVTNDTTGNTVSLSQSVTMQIHITNTGDGQATGVPLAYILSSPGQNITSITTSGCGSSPGQSNTSTTLNFTSLQIDVGTACIVTFTFSISGSASNGDMLAQTVDVGGSAEGGNNPPPIAGTPITVDLSNAAPNAPTSVASALLQGDHQLNAAGIDRASLSATLTDPDSGDQVRYRIQIAADTGFNDVAIDYRSPLGAQGGRAYTYQENSGTYITGSGSTVLTDRPYYLRIRTEDNSGANSTWHTISGIAFTYDTAAPVAPTTPFLVGHAGVGSATIGWNATVDSHPHPLIPYRIEASPTADFTAFTDVDTSDLSHFFSSLSTNAHYYFRLYVRDAAGNISIASSVLSVFIPAAASPTPSSPSSSSMVPSIPATSPPASQATHSSASPMSKSPSSLTAPATSASGNGTTTVVIYVRDARGNAVDHAKVTLHSEPRVAYSAKDGYVKFANVPIGRHTVIVEYADLTSTAPVDVKNGVQELHITLTLKNLHTTDRWCWLWLLLILLIILFLIWRYYRWRKRRKEGIQRQLT